MRAKRHATFILFHNFITNHFNNLNSMKRILSLVLLAFLLVQTVDVHAAGPFKWAPRSKNAPAEWQQALGAPAHRKAPSKAPQTTADVVLPSTESFGYLDLPDGTTWFVTAELRKEIIGEEGEYYTEYNITGVKATIYDQNYQPVGYIDDNFELPEGTEKCSSIQFGATVTRKFFNTDDNYEVMLMMNYKPAGEFGSIQYTRVYSLNGASSNASYVDTLPGYCASAINNSADQWSEDFFMEFFTGQEDTDTELLYTFDIYTKASWSSPKATSIKSFTVDMVYVMSDGDNEGLPVVMTSNGRNVYVAVAKYEKTFFENPFDFTNDTLSKDNHYVIELWSREGYATEMTLKKTTSIPCEDPSGDFAMRSYSLGMFTLNNDINFNFTDDKLPAYIISVVDTGWQEGQSSCFFAVYDTDGNILKTFGQDNLGYLQLNSIAGQPEQFCFVESDEAGKMSFSFMDFPSLNKVATIPVEYSDGTENLNLSNSLDRTAYGSSYSYVIASIQGETDEDDNTLHPVAWFDAEGNLIRVDRINGGKNIMMIKPYIFGHVLNPWFFNTDNKQEYLIYAQRLNDDSTTATHTELCVINTDGEMLLQYPFNTKDSGIYTAVVNMDNNPAIWITYNSFSDDLYHSEFVNLPLNKLQGDGSADNPYQISTAGDMALIKNNMSAHYVLTADIDYEGRAFTPFTEEFTGSIDGALHTIRNFTLSDAPMFAAIRTASETEKCEIKDITLSNVTVNGNTDAVLASEITSAELSNVHVYKADIEIVSNSFGTLANNVNSTVISECSAVNVTINASKTTDVGGLVSTLGNNSSVVASYFNGSITALNTVGGIASNGRSTTSTIKDCHVNATITAEHTIGGIMASSARGLIERCEVEGEITATGLKSVWSDLSPTGSKYVVSVGGIVGYINLPASTYDDDYNIIPGTWDTVVKGCVVGLSAINIEAAADDETLFATAHRIAGRTCVDEDPEITGYGPDWEPILGDPYTAEPGLVDNYSLDDLARVQASVADELTSTEGKSIAYDELDSELLGTLGYGFFGYSAEEPWVTSYTGLPRLYFEAAVGASILFNPSSVSIAAGEKATVVLVLENVEFDALTFNISDESGCMATPVNFDEDGNVVIEIEVYKEGTYTVSATNGTITATLTVTGTSGITDVAADSDSTISYDGNILRSGDGSSVSLYSISGVLVKAPAPVVSVEGLPTGIYIARNANDVLKITVR